MSHIPGWNKTRRTITKEEQYYNMSHKKRGIALILNQDETRVGTDRDCKILHEVFTNLAFQVDIQHNLTYESISKCIQEISKMDHSNHDCLLITVLTHGELGMLKAKDIKYSFRKLWCYFTDKHCPTLAGKPKIFIIQACRGSKCDNGIILTNEIETDGVTAMSENPTHPDFLFAYSTPPDYYSWRNTGNGSWFIQALCDNLTEYATRMDILTILTWVCEDVAVEYESNTPDEINLHKKKQIPNFCSTLTRLLIFTNPT